MRPEVVAMLVKELAALRKAVHMLGTNNACQPGAVGPKGYEERLEVGAIEHLAMEVKAAGELVAGAIEAGCDAIVSALGGKP